MEDEELDPELKENDELGGFLDDDDEAVGEEEDILDDDDDLFLGEESLDEEY